MSGLILRGAVENVPGLTIRNWQDDARLRLRMSTQGPMKADGAKRSESGKRWMRAIVLHTTTGEPFQMKDGRQEVLAGAGPSTQIAVATNRWWSTNDSYGGAHLVIDFDGSVACLADLALEQTFHAGPVNDHTVGIEIASRWKPGYKPGDPKISQVFEAQLETTVALCEWISARFRIQRQIPYDYKQGLLVPRCAGGGKEVVGIYGHRDVTLSRGYGDPGDAVFERLAAAGFERLDLRKGEDILVWKRRQILLGAFVDGVPGPATAGAIATWQEERGERGTGVLSPEQRAELDAEGPSPDAAA